MFILKFTKVVAELNSHCSCCKRQLRRRRRRQHPTTLPRRTTATAIIGNSPLVIRSTMLAIVLPLPEACVDILKPLFFNERYLHSYFGKFSLARKAV
jgi:hypothetical protein